MNDSDINRFKVIQDVCDRRIRRVDAADILDLSVRHIRRLLNRLSTLGAQSLAHAARGRPSNRCYSEDFTLCMSPNTIIRSAHLFYMFLKSAFYCPRKLDAHKYDALIPFKLISNFPQHFHSPLKKLEEIYRNGRFRNS